MTEWQQAEQTIKSAADIVAKLFSELEANNARFANDEIQHDEWSAEMRRIDQKLGIFGLAVDRRERFSRSGKL